MRLQDERGGLYALGIATDEPTLRAVERDLALSVRLVVAVPHRAGGARHRSALRAGQPGAGTHQRRPGRGAHGPHGPRRPAVPGHRARSRPRCARVLETGRAAARPARPSGRTPADPDDEHAWNVSYYRLEDPAGRVLGVAISVVDVSEQYHAANEAAEARRRLDLIARRLGAHRHHPGPEPHRPRTGRPRGDRPRRHRRRRPPRLRPGRPRAAPGPRPEPVADPRPGRRGRLPHRGAPGRRPARATSPSTTRTAWSPGASPPPGRSWSRHVGPGTWRTSPATRRPPPCWPRRACTPTWPSR